MNRLTDVERLNSGNQNSLVSEKGKVMEVEKWDRVKIECNNFQTTIGKMDKFDITQEGGKGTKKHSK